MKQKNKILIAVLVIVLAMLAGGYGIWRYAENTNTDPIPVVESDLTFYQDSKLHFSMKLPSAIDSRFPSKGNRTSPVYVISNEKGETAYLVPAESKEKWMEDSDLTLNKMQQYEADIRGRIKFYPILKEGDLLAALQNYFFQSNFKVNSWENLEADAPDIYKVYFTDKNPAEKLDIGAVVAMKFSPDKKRVAIWGLGNEPQFVLTTVPGVKQFDKTMIESLKVE